MLRFCINLQHWNSELKGFLIYFTMYIFVYNKYLCFLLMLCVNLVSRSGIIGLRNRNIFRTCETLESAHQKKTPTKNMVIYAHFSECSHYNFYILRKLSMFFLEVYWSICMPSVTIPLWCLLFFLIIYKSC